MTGNGPGGLGQRAGPAGLPGKLQVSSVLFYFPSVFFYLILCHSFEFKQNSNNARTSSEYFYVASWTFPEAHKLSQSI